MPVEIFSQEEFEAALPCHKESGVKLWAPLGMLQGEYCYLITVTPAVGKEPSPFAILVRSSIDSSGRSAETGEDSIRAYIVCPDTLKPWGGKVSRWTTRLPGWQERLTTKVLRPLAVMLGAIGKCASCGGLVKPFKVKKPGPNKGKLFVACKNDGCKAPAFIFLDADGEPERKPTEPTRAAPVVKPPPVKAPPQEDDVICPNCGTPCEVRIAGPNAKNPGKAFYVCPNRCPGWIGWAE